MCVAAYAHATTQNDPNQLFFPNIESIVSHSHSIHQPQSLFPSNNSQSLFLLATITFLFILSCDEDILSSFIPNTELPSIYGTIKDYNTNAI